MFAGMAIHDAPHIPEGAAICSLYKGRLSYFFLQKKHASLSSAKCTPLADCSRWAQLVRGFNKLRLDSVERTIDDAFLYSVVNCTRPSDVTLIGVSGLQWSRHQFHAQPRFFQPLMKR
jgi:hypothetical protein